MPDLTPGLDDSRVRADTPGADDGIFLDSAGSSLPPTPVVDTVVEHLRREAAIGGYRAAAERQDDMLATRASIGTLLGTPAESIALSDSATRAWSDFFHAVPVGAGDRILLSGVEYASNAVAALARARRVGASVEYVPSDGSGRIDIDALNDMLDERVRVVSVVHAPTNGGLINRVREVSDAAHRHGALVLLDACQSIGQMRVDVGELDVDAASGTGRKWLRGPRGTGLLYVRPDLIDSLEPHSIDLHSASWTGPGAYRLADGAARFEFWEHDVAARLGLGRAVRYLLDLGVDAVEAAVARRAEHLRRGLSGIAGVTVRDLGERRSGIVTFTVDGRDPLSIRDALRASGVTVTVSHAGSTLLDMTRRDLSAVIRASPHYFVSTDELDRALELVSDAV